MEIVIKEIRKKDYKKAIRYAIEGMQFNRYSNNKIFLNLYGRYFWYLELTNSTQIISAYIGDELVGVLLANVEGEKKYKSFSKSLYIKIYSFFQNILYKEGVGMYNEANKEMFEKYKNTNNPNGEIKFFAVNPNIKGKGIGSKILEEFERREKGKQFFLFTDEGCSYQFYEHRGFERVGEKDILLDLNDRKFNFKCFLYSKNI